MKTTTTGKTQADLDNEELDEMMTEEQKAEWQRIGEDEEAKWGK